MRKSVLSAVFLFVLPAYSQSFAVGFKAGIPLTPYFDTGDTGSRNGGADYSSATRRYTLGVSGEWLLTNSIGFELDVLYRRMGYTGTANFFDTANGNFSNSTINVRGNSWDFPVMFKYRFGHVVRPYLAGGGVLRYVGPVHESGEVMTGSAVGGPVSTSPIDTSEPSDLNKRFYPGLTFAGGVEIGAGRFRVLPEIRYTRWTANISGPGGVLRLAPDQVDVMVGLLF